MKPETKQAIEHFKKYIKQGMGVNKALKQAGLSKRTYSRYIDLIWADPEIAPMREKKTKHFSKEGKDVTISGAPEAPLLNKLLEDREEELPGVVKELKKSIRIIDEVDKLKRQLTMKLGIPISSTPREIAEKVEEGGGGEGVGRFEGDVVDEIEGMLKRLDVSKSRAIEFLNKMGYKVTTQESPASVDEAKELLEKMGYKVEDGRISLDKVREIVEAAEQEWIKKHDVNLEKSLEERKVAAAENVLSIAIDRVFRPIQMFISAYLKKVVGVEIPIEEEGEGNVYSYATTYDVPTEGDFRNVGTGNPVVVEGEEGEGEGEEYIARRTSGRKNRGSHD